MKYTSEVNRYNNVDYCCCTSTTSQIAAQANTAYPMILNNYEEGNNITVSNDSQVTPHPTKIVFHRSGVYHLTFCAQLDRVAGAGTATVNTWLRKNGETNAYNIPRSDARISMTGNASATKTLVSWSFVFSANQGDFVQLCWATTDTNIHIVTAAADTTPGQERPAIPSVILSVHRL